jgi:hypothetical protein
MDKPVTLQSLDDPKYVDPIALIKLAQRFNIRISDRFVAADTQQKRVALRDWLYAEIKAANPGWVPEY